MDQVEIEPGNRMLPVDRGQHVQHQIDGGIADRVQVNVADIRQQSTMNYLVRDRDVIFSLAGQVSHVDSMRDPYADLEINCRSQLTVLEACRNYPTLSNARRITFEYVMLKGVNDSLAEARELVRLLAGIPAKINLIPFNPWPGAPYECSDWEQIERFAEVVNKAGYASPVRTPRGRDIHAACGQLKSASVKQRASAVAIDAAASGGGV